MATTLKTQTSVPTHSNTEIGKFFGELFSFNTSLKLFHWNVTGPGSYAQHIALDQAIDALNETIDRIVETTLAMNGDLMIIVPQATAPLNIINHCENFYEYVNHKRELFKESFSGAILDDYQEAIQELLYRLKRLK